MLETVETFVGDADQLIGLFSVLREIGNTVIHVDADTHLQALEVLCENHLDAAAEGHGLRGISLGQEQSEFVATDAKGRVRSAQGVLQGGCGGAQPPGQTP